MSEARRSYAVVLGGTQVLQGDVKTLAANGTTVYLSVVRKTRERSVEEIGREP